MSKNRIRHMEPGMTLAERYVNRLCKASFLSLWSFSNPYRDQGKINGGHGHEICDQMVLFDKEVLIFSDKDCKYPETPDEEFNWRRWFSRSIEAAARQSWGAEKWIRNHPDKIFLDRACQSKFPFDLTSLGSLNFHLIVVAHGASARSKKLFGGSGSLMLRNDIKGIDQHTEPLIVGDLDPDRSFVHVLDDTTLDIIINRLDTITDFVEYLKKKEALFRGEKSVFAAGEEEMLAIYLRNINKQGEHDFQIPKDTTGIAWTEGIWEEYETSPQRTAQKDADKISYAWDKLIESFAKHALARTQPTFRIYS